MIRVTSLKDFQKLPDRIELFVFDADKKPLGFVSKVNHFDVHDPTKYEQRYFVFYDESTNLFYMSCPMPVYSGELYNCYSQEIKLLEEYYFYTLESGDLSELAFVLNLKEPEKMDLVDLKQRISWLVVERYKQLSIKQSEVANLEHVLSVLTNHEGRP